MSKEITLTEYNKKIEELKEKRCQLWSQIHEIDAQIDSLEISGIDFIGKYIYVPIYGNMFVLEEYPDKDLDRINFRGITQLVPKIVKYNQKCLKVTKTFGGFKIKY